MSEFARCLERVGGAVKTRSMSIPPHGRVAFIRIGPGGGLMDGASNHAAAPLLRKLKPNSSQLPSYSNGHKF